MKGEENIMNIKIKPSGSPYQWKCIYCDKSTRAAHEPSGTSYGKCNKSLTGKHKFELSGR